MLSWLLVNRCKIRFIFILIVISGSFFARMADGAPHLGLLDLEQNTTLVATTVNDELDFVNCSGCIIKVRLAGKKLNIDKPVLVV